MSQDMLLCPSCDLDVGIQALSDGRLPQVHYADDVLVSLEQPACHPCSRSGRRPP